MIYDREVPIARIYLDAEGIEWEVVEVDGHRVPAARGESCLIFRAPHAIRRVWNFPHSWMEMSAKELSRLSWQR
jgi:hypothetical protein